MYGLSLNYGLMTTIQNLKPGDEIRIITPTAGGGEIVITTVVLVVDGFSFLTTDAHTIGACQFSGTIEKTGITFSDEETVAKMVPLAQVILLRQVRDLLAERRASIEGISNRQAGNQTTPTDLNPSTDLGDFSIGDLELL